MKISIIKNAFKKIITGVIVAAVWIGIWQCAHLLVDNETFIPAPFSVFKRIIVLAFYSPEAEFWTKVTFSIGRIILGFVIGVFIGALMGFVTSIKLADKVFSPVKAIVRATPIASFIMLLWLFIARDSIPVFVSALMVVPIVWGNVSTGIKNVGKEYREFALIYEINKFKQIKHIFLPGIMPYFATSLCTGAGLVWKAGVAAEVLVLPKYSIGMELNNAKNIIETVDVFAWTVVIIVVSILLELLIKVGLKWIEKRFAFVGLT